MTITSSGQNVELSGPTEGWGEEEIGAFNNALRDRYKFVADKLLGTISLVESAVELGSEPPEDGPVLRVVDGAEGEVSHVEAGYVLKGLMAQGVVEFDSSNPAGYVLTEPRE